VGRPRTQTSTAARADSRCPATLGRVAVATTAPLFAFGGYHDATDKTAERFTADGQWYLTGDTAAIDDDGALFFSSRDDDVIIMAGYRIGPFDVESVLVTHPTSRKRLSSAYRMSCAAKSSKRSSYSAPASPPRRS
jgi:acetyl-CoA synthetase